MSYVPWYGNPAANPTTPDGVGTATTIHVWPPDDGPKAPCGFVWPKQKKRKKKGKK